jgi:6-phosphogluconate dehydrogenase (decarboxylating)
MFVNDTGHLPDSGRVCVAGFQPDQAAPRAWYSVVINAARATVEPMAEPKNPAYVLGVGSEVQSVKGPVFAAYFAASRERFDTQPNYKGALFVLVDGAVYAVRQEKVTTSIRRRPDHARVHACRAATGRSAASSTRGPFTANRSCHPTRASHVPRIFSGKCLPWCGLTAEESRHAGIGNDRARAHGREHDAAPRRRRHRVRGPRRARRRGEVAGGAAHRGRFQSRELVAKLDAPRAIWIMVPAAVVDSVLAELTPLLSAGDVVIDGGNSFYRDDIRRGAELARRGLHYLDVGTSGGVAGARRGYCLMIGGETDVVKRLEPVFAALAPGLDAADPRRATLGGDTAPLGYLHCGPHGAGHFVKMIHNGIEYGVMAAYAEGLNILHGAGIGKQEHAKDAETAPLGAAPFYQYEFDLPRITRCGATAA